MGASRSRQSCRRSDRGSQDLVRPCLRHDPGRAEAAGDGARGTHGLRRANEFPEERLWKGITVRHHGRVTEGRFDHWRVTDITALPGCTKIEDLALHDNNIADISPLANRGALVSLSLYRNRVTDISALASCGKLEEVWLPENSITDISALASCGRLRYLDIGVNRVTDISALAHCRKLWGVALPYNEITDISVLESCPRLEIVEALAIPSRGRPRR